MQMRIFLRSRQSGFCALLREKRTSDASAAQCNPESTTATTSASKQQLNAGLIHNDKHGAVLRRPADTAKVPPISFCHSNRHTHKNNENRIFSQVLSLIKRRIFWLVLSTPKATFSPSKWSLSEARMLSGLNALCRRSNTTGSVINVLHSNIVSNKYDFTISRLTQRCETQNDNYSGPSVYDAVPVMSRKIFIQVSAKSQFMTVNENNYNWH